MAEEPLRIGPAARVLGTTTRTLRYYEEYGLLARPVTTSGGQRRYDPTDLERARTILALRRLGLSLATIREILDTDATADLTALADAHVRLVELLTAAARRPAS